MVRTNPAQIEPGYIMLLTTFSLDIRFLIIYSAPIINCCTDSML